MNESTRRGARRRAPAVPAVLAAAVPAVVTAVLGGCVVAPDDGPSAPSGPNSPGPAGSAGGAQPSRPAVRLAQRRLPALDTVAREPAGLAPYRRDAFGTAWADVDGNGCNQRDDVLLRDAVPGTTTTAVQGACDHDVLAGRWRDPYTGAVLDFDDLKDPAQAQALQIDHVVPLAEAWRSGAATWSDDRRREFANDLGVLLAADGPTNAAKGDDDPAAWRPRQAHQCSYAVTWIAVKHRWRLAADPSESAALEEQLATCGG